MTFTFRTLLDRVEKGEGRDLSLEGDLLRVLLGDDLRQWPKRYLGLGEAITSSIDASRALVQAVIPGTLVASGSMENGPFCSMVVPREDGTYIGGGVQAFATSEPRAVLACLLRAKIAQEERHEAEACPH